MGEDEHKLIIEPVPPKSLLEVLATLEPLNEIFPPIIDPLLTRLISDVEFVLGYCCRFSGCAIRH
jgi:hypothetical protein